MQATLRTVNGPQLASGKVQLFLRFFSESASNSTQHLVMSQRAMATLQVQV